MKTFVGRTYHKMPTTSIIFGIHIVLQIITDCVTFKHFLQYQVIVINDFSNSKDNNFEPMQSDLE